MPSNWEHDPVPCKVLECRKIRLQGHRHHTWTSFHHRFSNPPAKRGNSGGLTIRSCWSVRKTQRVFCQDATPDVLTIAQSHNDCINCHLNNSNMTVTIHITESHTNHTRIIISLTAGLEDGRAAPLCFLLLFSIDQDFEQNSEF